MRQLKNKALVSLVVVMGTSVKPENLVVKLGNKMGEIKDRRDCETDV